jgi:hypothetical protein
MATLSLELAYNVRDNSKEIPNFSVHANVSRAYWEDRNKSIVERSEKRQINQPEWSYSHNTGVSSYFRRHNGFKDQERHNRIARNFSLRQGTFVKYYATSYDPTSDALYHEDNNRTVERYFDVPVMLTFQPENEIYSRFGIQHLDEFEVHVHMSLFMELQYASLRKMCVEPACSSTEHNPVWSQRGYEAFRYHGYSAAQIFPKAGDLLKIEAFDTLYEIESVKDAAPEYQHRWRKYWWKLFLTPAMDNGKTVDAEVLNDPEQEGFINDLMGTMNNNGSVVDQFGNPVGNVFDVSSSVDELKKSVLFRPPEVNESVSDISGDNNFYACFDKFGKW